MFEYQSFLARPEHLDEKLNTQAIEGWQLFSILPALEKHGIWFVVMVRTVNKKKQIED